MDRGDRQVTVYGVSESHMTEQLSTVLFPYYKCRGRKHMEGGCLVHASLLGWETVSLECLQGELLGLKMILLSCRPYRLYSPQHRQHCRGVLTLLHLH